MKTNQQTKERKRKERKNNDESRKRKRKKKNNKKRNTKTMKCMSQTQINKPTNKGKKERARMKAQIER